MSKKLNLFRLIMSLALAATLLLSMTLPALASVSPPTGPLYNSENETSIEIAITKLLRMPVGTEPAKVFEFKVEPISFNDRPYSSLGSDQSKIPNEE